MNKTKRPALLAGLCITTVEVLMFIIAQLFAKDSHIIVQIVFWVCIVILLINISSFYTVNLSAKEFKEKRYLPWLSFILISIYECYYLAVLIITVRDGISGADSLVVAQFSIILLGLLLYIPGILTKIIDNKLTYEEQDKKNLEK